MGHSELEVVVQQIPQATTFNMAPEITKTLKTKSTIIIFMFSSIKFKLTLIFLTCILLSTTLMVETATAAQVTWIVQTIDAAIHVGEYCSMKIDSNNHIHIAYYDDYWKDLKYASSFDGGSTWTIGPADTGNGQNMGKFCSLALDSNNRPHISYFDETNYMLRYAHWNGTNWHIYAVDNNSGGYTSIALDSADNPHISYYDYDLARLKYARWTGSTWSIQAVDSSSGTGSSIALDSNNYPQIAYRSTSPNQLKYARWTGTTWNIQVLDSVAVQDPSLVIDPWGYSHLSYYEESSGNLIYAIYDSGGTLAIKEIVDASADVGRWNSLVIDQYQIAHISYYDLLWQDLKYARREPGVGWFIRTIDTVGDMGFLGTSIAIDSDNHPHISYNDATNHNLKIARDPDETFSVTGYEGIDSDGDQNDDSLLIFMDINTNYPGPLNVSVSAILIDPSTQNIVDDASSIYTITGNQMETNSLTLTVPTGSPDGLYNVKLFLTDEMGNSEDTITLNNAAYLYPLNTTTQIGYLQGTVTDIDTGLPIVADIIVNDDWTNPRAYTNMTGQYTLQLSAGTHKISATDSEGSIYSVESANVTIIASVTTTQDFQLKRQNWILSVEAEGSGAIQTDLSSEPWIPPFLVTYQINSTAQVQAIPSTGWRLDHWRLNDENVGSSNPVYVYMNRSHLLTAVFTQQPETGWLAGNVRDLTTETPIEGAEITANTQSVFTDPAGNYEMQLPAGNYTVTVKAASYHNQTVQVTINSSAITTRNFLLEGARANIESSNTDGNKKDAFDIGETIFVYGSNYSPSTTYNIYLVEDVTTWTNGTTIPPRIPGTLITITSNDEGAIPPTPIWINPQTTGRYDIIVDVNGNGIYDAGIDALDNDDVEVTAGLTIPEISPISMMAIVTLITSIAILASKCKLNE